MSPAPEYPMASVRKDDLDVLVIACLRHLPDEPGQDVAAAFARLEDARHEAAGAIPEEDPRPDGFFGRVELPGYRQHTGWLAEETRFGQQLAVVRDWDGNVLAEVCIGPMCQVVHLPTPLRRPEPPKAITAGGDDDEELERYDEEGAGLFGGGSF